jgi:hypothetical protein
MGFLLFYLFSKAFVNKELRATPHNELCKWAGFWHYCILQNATFRILQYANILPAALGVLIYRAFNLVTLRPIPCLAG